MRKHSKNPYAKLRKKAWDTFSYWIRHKRDKGRCYTCGKKNEPKKMNAGHYEHINCLDFDERNIHCQCVYCNLRLHGNRNIYALHLEKQYGHGILQELDRLKWKNRYFKVSELNEIILKYGDNKRKQKKNSLSRDNKV